MNKLQPFITDAIKKMTAQFKLHLLGPRKLSPDDLKYIAFSYHSFDPKTTLEAAYLHGNTIHGGLSDSIDKTTINQIEDNAHNYIKTLEQKAIADTTRVVGELVHERNQKIKQIVDPVARAKQTKEILKQTKKMLKDQRKKIQTAANTIAEHELNNAQSFGAFDGILSVAKKMGIEDPVVFKIPIKDKDLCKHCEDLHLLSDKVTPRVYKLSELRATPGDWKNPEPSIGPVHPHCRCQLTTLMPGYGFSGAGRVTYIAKDHDEYKKQRGE
jgi:hypothetical protein